MDEVGENVQPAEPATLRAADGSRVIAPMLDGLLFSTRAPPTPDTCNLPTVDAVDPEKMAVLITRPPSLNVAVLSKTTLLYVTCDPS
jgi:hypothetical protein